MNRKELVEKMLEARDNMVITKATTRNDRGNVMLQVVLDNIDSVVEIEEVSDAKVPMSDDDYYARIVLKPDFKRGG